MHSRISKFKSRWTVRARNNTKQLEEDGKSQLHQIERPPETTQKIMMIGTIAACESSRSQAHKTERKISPALDKNLLGVGVQRVVPCMMSFQAKPLLIKTLTVAAPLQSHPTAMQPELDTKAPISHGQHQECDICVVRPQITRDTTRDR